MIEIGKLYELARDCDEAVSGTVVRIINKIVNAYGTRYEVEIISPGPCDEYMYYEEEDEDYISYYEDLYMNEYDTFTVSEYSINRFSETDPFEYEYILQYSPNNKEILINTMSTPVMSDEANSFVTDVTDMCNSYSKNANSSKWNHFANNEYAELRKLKNDSKYNSLNVTSFVEDEQPELECISVSPETDPYTVRVCIGNSAHTYYVSGVNKQKGSF